MFGLKKINKKLKIIMAKQSELATEMAAVTAQIAKIGQESSATLQKVTDLQAVIDGMGDNVTPELQAAFDALKAHSGCTSGLVLSL